MSEKIYAWLLHLFPSRFRHIYGEESLQLFRDRYRDERGVLQRLRLWLDLLFDLMVSIPRTYRAQPTFFAASAQPRSNGIPSFQILENKPPRPGAFLFGSIVAFAALSVFLVLFNQVEKQRPFRASTAQPLPQNAVPPSTSAHPGEKASNDDAAETGMMGNATAGASNPAIDGVKADKSKLKRLISQGGLEQQPKLLNATSAMIQLFSTHNIVMFGEVHGSKQEYEWLCRLVKTPEFSDRVDDIVVEFGNSLYQKTVDRYVSGEDVPIEQVQKAWRNMVLSTVPVQPVYEQFYKAVREANLKHRGGHQLRIVLGSPPVDWEKIKDRKGLEPYINEREQWYTSVVKNEALAKGHRALLIMGAGHFLRGQEQTLQDGHQVVARGPGYIERELRAAGANSYLVAFGTNVIDNKGTVDQRFDSWPVPVIVPLADNWVGKLPAQPVLSGGYATATPLKLADQADALLYVAPCSSLKSVYVPRAELEGTPYGKEMARRNAIILGHPDNSLHNESEPQCVQP